VGNAGILVSTHFSRLLYEGKIRVHWWKSPELRHLFVQLLVLGFIFACAGAALSLAIAPAFLVHDPVPNAARLFLVVILDILVLTVVLFGVAVLAGTHFYNRGEDPDNFLIPITTSVADFGNMLLLAGLVILFF
ncbi:MAG: magnesium transporter, partial [Candidatus Diapherotrites archaeon]|nr:magnesium transporter [Candidatus Diapherotrites archaeon]